MYASFEQAKKGPEKNPSVFPAAVERNILIALVPRPLDDQVLLRADVHIINP
jgi:hypothetical protein